MDRGGERQRTSGQSVPKLAGLHVIKKPPIPITPEIEGFLCSDRKRIWVSRRFQRYTPSLFAKPDLTGLTGEAQYHEVHRRNESGVREWKSRSKR